MDNFLISFGFTDKEFIVYHTLVTRGPLTISDIVATSSLHRPYAYKTIRSLMEKKVVHISTSQHKKLYIAESPQKIKQILEKEKEKASEKLDVLEELYASPHLETTITHFQGKKGVMEIFADLVQSQKKGDIFYRYTSEKDTEYANTFLPSNYRTVRDKKQLERFVISTFDTASKKQKRLERATKVIPKGEAEFKQDCIQLIYCNKIAFINLASLQGLIIEDAAMASFQKDLFKMLYKRL